MVAVGASMLRKRGSEGDPGVRINKSIAVRLVGIGSLTGAIGIGGGILIIPGLLLGCGMAVLNAIGSPLFSVGAFGLTTAANYALSGLVDWTVAGQFIAGGVVGGFAGMRAAVGLSASKGALTKVFAGVLFAVAAYMLYRNAGALGLF